MSIQAIKEFEVMDLTDGYSVELSNDSYTFSGGVNGVEELQNIYIDVVSMIGSKIVECTIGTIQGIVNGITVVSDNAKPSPRLTITAKSPLKDSGNIVIPVKIGDVTINKTFSYSVVIKGSDGISVAASYKYYQLVDENLPAPSMPNKWPPSLPWTTTEPTYEPGSNKILYYTDLTLFSDSTYHYSPVNISSSYQAAKDAYEEAQEAKKTATNFIDYDEATGLILGNKDAEGNFEGFRTNLTANGFSIKDAENKEHLNIIYNLIELGKQSTEAVIKMCGSLAEIGLIDADFFENTENQVTKSLKYLQMVSENIRIRGNERVSIYQSKYDSDMNIAYKNGIYMDIHSGIDDPNLPIAQSIHLSSTVIEGIDEETGVGIERGSHVYLDSDGASMESQHNARVTAIDGNVYLTADGTTKDIVVNGVPARRFLKTQIMMVSGTIVVNAGGQSTVEVHSINGVKQMFKDKYGVDMGNIDPINLAICYTNGDPMATWVSITGSYIMSDGRIIAALSSNLSGQIRVHYQYITYIDVYDDSKWDDSVLIEETKLLEE